MKIRYLFLTILLSTVLQSSFAQVHLRISSLSGFPVSPTDTAYENRSYDSIRVDVQNIGNTVLNNDNIDIFLIANPANGIDTLYSDSVLYSIQLGSVANIQVSPYTFRPTHFDDGDNIVVVWPAARQTPHTSDTLTFHVYFISLLADLKENPTSEITIAPNPVSDYIILDLPSEMTFKQVRITDILGRTRLALNGGRNYIPTSDWSPGIYFLEYFNEKGNMITKRLIKN